MTEVIFAVYAIGALGTYAFLWVNRFDVMSPDVALGLSLVWPASNVIYLLRGGWWK